MKETCHNYENNIHILSSLHVAVSSTRTVLTHLITLGVSLFQRSTNSGRWGRQPSLCRLQ